MVVVDVGGTARTRMRYHTSPPEVTERVHEVLTEGSFGGKKGTKNALR
jgi:hypothetical protein